MMQGQGNMHIQGPQINQFNNISPAPVPRSSFQRDFSRRTTFNADVLVPIVLDEILPGDDINLRMNAFVRMSTPIKPLFDNLYLETFWAFVPNRLLWNNWERFQGQQTNPSDSTVYTIPKLNPNTGELLTTGFTNQSIYDYFGLPTLVSRLDNISALYNRAYDLFWNDWFRDENLQPSITVPRGDGPDPVDGYVLRKRNKRKDYFTSGLPWPQKGSPVTLNIGGSAPVNRVSNAQGWRAYSNGTNDAFFTGAMSAANGGSGITYLTTATTPSSAMSFDPMGGLVADLSSASAITINQLRQAALYQQILELDARGGTRYVESIYSRFGVVSPDFRLQRPELIGQGSTRINVYAVPQTAPTQSGTTPQGNLAAFGTATISGDHGCRYSATEHGILIGLLNVRADLTYQQGVPKMFSRRTRLDFYEPLLNGLGEQAILNKELFAQGAGVVGNPDDNVFAYQERFAEYRFKNSEITGKFRTNDPQTLNVWNVSQQFGSLPLLNAAFIELNTPMARVLATGNTEPHFLADMHFQYTHVRPMPMRSNPGITRL